MTAPEGGYDLEPEGHGFGKLLAPLALRPARKGADEFAQSIKRAVEAS